MKKILSALVFAICILSVNFCSADPYENNPDYIYIGTYGSGGYSNYLYRPSVDVQEYNPPHYQISGTFVSYGGKYTKSENWATHCVRYNWYTKETFSLKNGYWVKDPIETGIGRYYKNRANALFRVAYGMDFYGY